MIANPTKLMTPRKDWPNCKAKRVQDEPSPLLLSLPGLTQFGRLLHRRAVQFIRRFAHRTKSPHAPQTGDHPLIPKVTVVFEFGLLVVRDPRGIHNHASRHAKHAVSLHRAGLFLRREGRGLVGLPLAGRLELGSGADKELVHCASEKKKRWKKKRKKKELPAEQTVNTPGGAGPGRFDSGRHPFHAFSMCRLVLV